MTGTAPRSWLFVPGDRAERWLASAVASGAEAVILDLEDGVAPARRPAARDEVRRALEAGVESSVYVRVNAAGSEWWREDVLAVAGSPATGILLPKCAGPEDVAAVAAAWAEATDERLRVIAGIESAAGVMAAVSIAAQPAVIGLALGAQDLVASMGLIPSAAGDEILVARSLVCLAAASAGRWSVDTPSLELDDADRVESETRRAAALGFDGKLAVHPRQVPAIHRGFTPTPAAVAEARAVLATADALTSRERGVGRHADRMIDAPVVAAAREVIRRATAAEEGVSD